MSRKYGVTAIRVVPSQSKPIVYLRSNDKLVEIATESQIEKFVERANSRGYRAVSSLIDSSFVPLRDTEFDPNASEYAWRMYL